MVIAHCPYCSEDQLSGCHCKCKSKISKLQEKVRELDAKLKRAVSSLGTDAIPVIELGVSLIEELDKGIRGIEPVSAKVEAMNFGIHRIKEALREIGGES